MSVVKLSNIRLAPTESEERLREIAERELGAPVRYLRILKKSVDARKKSEVRLVYSIEFSDEEQVRTEQAPPVVPPSLLPQKPVLVVGSGPAGLFCALRLLERGVTPIVIERGKSVDERVRTTELFFYTGFLDPDCNIQFGEGGAGTFSDGKLNTGTHSELIGRVLSTFVRFGAPEEIEWLSKPHIGSDRLRAVVKNMREEIIRRGGKVLFNTRLEDIEVAGNRIRSVTLVRGGKREKTEVDFVVAAIGHSARDTLRMLNHRGAYMRAKDFAVGVRIEHLQENISRSQYGEAYKSLPPADYKLVSHASERAAFTFCMCPGGTVTPASSEEGGVVVNGMSNYARDGKNANSAVVVQVRREDFGGEVFGGTDFQRAIETAAFERGGGNYCAPAQRLEDFMRGRPSRGFGEISPSYSAGVIPTDISRVFPAFVTDTLRAAFADMDKRLKGFACPDAVLTAPETRTSSPVRIERDELFRSVTLRNLYPCGEGAGYAGGITSSAVDGIRVADALCEQLISSI